MLCAALLLWSTPPVAAQVEADSAAVSPVRRRTFWALDLKGLGGFFPSSYSRVDGLVAGWGGSLRSREEIKIPAAGVKQVVDHPERPSLEFSLLVPTARRAAGGTFGLSQTLSQRLGLKAALGFQATTASSDAWRCPQPWTSLAYFITGKDRQYYYDRRGGQFSLSREFTDGLSLELTAARDEIRPLERRGVWTIGKSGLLKDNPPTERGGDFSLELAARLDRTAGEPFFRVGWSGEIAALKGLRGLGGDFDYTLWRFGLSGARRLFSRNNYAFASLTGLTAGGRLPTHRLFSLGAQIKGLDTFARNFDLFDRRGDRLWLFSLGFERLLPWQLPLVARHLSDPSLELDFDAGTTRQSQPGDSGFDLFSQSLKDLESALSVGGGVSLSRVRVSVFYVHNLNRAYHGPRFDFRVRGL